MPSAAPAAVGAYIGAAYFFTSSTSFANPAITVGRMFSEHVRRHRAGIRAGVRARPARRRELAAFAAIRTLYPDLTPAQAQELVVPHHGAGA